MTRKQKPDPKAVYVCHESFVAAGAVAVEAGTRLRGDQDVVQRYFARFSPDGTPPSAWPQPVIRRDAPEPPRNPPREIPADRQVRARRSFTAWVGRPGRHHVVQRGQLFDRDDPVVKRAPAEFETVPQPLEVA